MYIYIYITCIYNNIHIQLITCICNNTYNIYYNMYPNANNMLLILILLMVGFGALYKIDVPTCYFPGDSL